jgi:50S ribosomal protein L16 3-hydroxylase
MQLDQFDIGVFLSGYWQKKPLLIRNPWDRWANPLPPDELAGLACEEEVESRLVRASGGTWALEHGPFAETRFDRLGGEPWTLLVQSVDLFVPAVAALIEPFRFVPNWRIDDVMVSYASDGGGVGPHFDQYDVFLVQGLGRRRWRLGQRCDEAAALLPHEDLRLLAQFEPSEEWVLEPGDILYVPPGFAHEGTAVGGDCMTYSVGFRAPSRGDLGAGWSEHVFGRLKEDDRYSDPNLQRQRNPGEITAEAIARLHGMATEKMLDRGEFARWFGRYASAPKYPELDWRPDVPVEAEEVRRHVGDGTPLCRNPGSRFSFVRHEGFVLLFVDGECFECSGESARFAEELCARDGLQIPGTDKAVGLVVQLLNRGSVSFSAD